MIKKLLNGIIGSTVSNRQTQRRADLYRDLIRHEAKIGGELFGAVGNGGRREFFCLDEHTWVWHEEWIDANGQKQITTTRYDVRPNGILKSRNGHYQALTPQEAQRLYQAAKIYKQRVGQELYSFAS